jgi:dephospho-CoA kinase
MNIRSDSMLIGVTGKSGSGKSTFARALANQLNYFYVDIDTIGHEVLSTPDAIQRLLNVYGTNIFVDGKLDRKLLGDLVFNDRHEMANLTDIVWADMKAKIDNILKEHSNVVLDWILLPHTPYWNLLDKKILVKSDTDTRIQKVLERDNISKEYFNKRESASIDYTEQFDLVLENDYTSEKLNDNIKQTIGVL